MQSRITDVELIDRQRAALSAAASRLRLPVHLIRGGASDLVSPEAVAHFRSLVPYADYSNIADATHMEVGDKNDAFGQAIVEFLIRTHANDVSQDWQPL